MNNHSLPHHCDKYLKKLVINKLIEQKSNPKQKNLNYKYCDCGNELTTEKEKREDICRDCI